MTLGLTNQAALVPAVALTTPQTQPAQNPNPMTPQQVNPSPRNPCLFGSLRWTNQSQRKVASKGLIDITAITGPGPNPHTRLTPRSREEPLQPGQPQLEVRVLLELLLIRGLQVSTTYQCPLYLAW